MQTENEKQKYLQSVLYWSLFTVSSSWRHYVFITSFGSILWQILPVNFQNQQKWTTVSGRPPSRFRPLLTRQQLSHHAIARQSTLPSTLIYNYSCEAMNTAKFWRLCFACNRDSSGYFCTLGNGKPPTPACSVNPFWEDLKVVQRLLHKMAQNSDSTLQDP